MFSLVAARETLQNCDLVAKRRSNSGRSGRLRRGRALVMGTRAEVAVVHENRNLASEAIRAGLGELRSVDRLMTHFTSTSDVGRANRSAWEAPVEISQSTAMVIRQAIAWAEWSDGRFDPCLGKVMRLWDVGRRRVPPPLGSVQRLADRRLYRALELAIRDEKPYVRFLDPDVELDLGGIAKGFGVDRAVEALEALGIRNGIVSVGGDLYALGSSPDGDPWKIGVRSMTSPERLAGFVELCDTAIATSGDYFQHFEYRGHHYHHILDPRVAAPRSSTARGVTVIADTCLAADAAATAVFGASPATAHRILKGRPGNPCIVRPTDSTSDF